MSQINLLPWRETLRKTQLRIFFYLCMLVLILVIMLSLGLDLALRQSFKQQQKANQYLTEQRRLLVPKLTQINILKKQHRQLMDNINIINKLQQRQQQSLLILMSLAKAVPSSIYLDHVIYDKNRMTLRGYTNDNNAITMMNQQLMQSSLFKDINLAEIRANPKQEFAHDFTITLHVNEVTDAA